MRADEGSSFIALQSRIVELFRENESAVVRVKAAYQADQDDDGKLDDVPQVVVGTGFFISKEGHVLTNASTVLNPDRIWVVHKGVEYAARVIGYDKSTNLALLKVLTLPKDFHFIPLSDNPDLPPQGTMLLRIGSPMELAPSPSFGMVSGVESRFGQHLFPCILVRTNISANPGDGGSPVLDLNGRLIGIQVGSLSEIGSTYVLPARAAMRVRDDLLFSGKVSGSWIGFEVLPDTSVANGTRVMLRNVIDGSPAAAAGMKAGDQILQVGVYRIGDLDDLRNALFYTRVGEYVPIKIMRAGQELDLTVRMAQRPQTDEPGPSLVQPMPVRKPVPGGMPGDKMGRGPGPAPADEIHPVAPELQGGMPPNSAPFSPADNGR